MSHFKCLSLSHSNLYLHTLLDLLPNFLYNLFKSAAVRTMTNTMTIDGDSVRPNSSTPITFVRTQNQSAVGRVNDTCFRCQKQGHWSRDCPTGPNRTPQNTAAPPTSATFLGDDGSHNSSRRLCFCGAGKCRCLAKWFDKVESIEGMNVPICGCGAGRCAVTTEKSGPNAGRKKFICPIKKGHGACNFFRWLDDELETTTNSDVDLNTIAPQSTLAIIDDPSQISNNIVTKKETGGEPFRKQCKRLRNEEFDKEISMKGTTLQGAFPSFNLLSGVEITDRFDAGRKILTPDPISETPPMEVATGDRLMELSVLEAFGNTATNLQNKLLSLLQSMDYHHHALMAQQAAATFAALDRLRVDYRAFRDRVDELISRASSFSEIDRTVESNRGLVDLYSREKIEFEDVSQAHAETVAELEAAKERLRLLKREADRLRDSLSRTEAEVLCCEGENREIEKRLALKSREMEDTRERSGISAGVLELSRQKEAEREAAKAAYQKARGMLHGKY